MGFEEDFATIRWLRGQREARMDSPFATIVQYNGENSAADGSAQVGPDRVAKYRWALTGPIWLARVKHQRMRRIATSNRGSRAAQAPSGGPHTASAAQIIGQLQSDLVRNSRLSLRTQRSELFMRHFSDLAPIETLSQDRRTPHLRRHVCRNFQTQKAFHDGTFSSSPRPTQRWNGSNRMLIRSGLARHP